MDNNKKKSNGMVWVFVVLAIIVVGVVVLSKQRAKTIEPEDSVTTVESTEDTSEGQGTPPVTGAATLSYQQALTKYKGQLIQVNDACQATPSHMTFKNGISLMIDNRSAIAHTFKLGSSYTIKPYGFKIITLSSATVPATYLLDCDKSQNIATVTLQK